MHIRRGKIRLLVPCRRRQHDVRVQRVARHTEIERNEEVELALERTARLLQLLLLAPLDLLRVRRTVLLLEDAVLRAEEILEEVVIALRGRAEQVAPPDKEVAREILRCIRILPCELQALFLQALHDVVLDAVRTLEARCLCICGDVVRAAVERRIGRCPAETRRHDGIVRRVAVTRRLICRRNRIRLDLITAPLIRRKVVERGGVEQLRRTLPVRAAHNARPALIRTELLLSDVVRPAAAVAPLAAREEQEVDDRAVDGIRVEPVVDATAHDNHGSPVRLDGVIRDLACRLDDEIGRNARVLLLPCGRIRRVVLVRACALAADAAVNRIVREREVVDRRDEHLAVRRLHAAHRQCARQCAFPAVVAEVRQLHLNRPRLVIPDGETRADLRARVAVLLADVPLLLRRPTLAERAVRNDDLARLVVHHVVAEVRVLLVTSHVARGEHTPGDICAVLFLLDTHEEREVRILPRVLKEERRCFINVVFLEDDVPHRHRHRGVAADLERDPRIREHRGLGVVGRNRHNLCALVAHLRHKVCVRRARERYVRAPRDEVARIVPVARLGHVRLLAPDLRARGRQIGIPVVEREADAAHQLHEADARRIAQHRHRGDDGEAEDAVRTVGVRRVEHGRSDQLADLLPVRAHKAAHAACLLILLLLCGIGSNALPCLVRVRMRRTRLTPKSREFPAHIRVLHAVRTVEIPRERCSTRAAARLEVRHVRRRFGIVRCLILPRHNPVLDVDVPAARARAVDPMRRAHGLVERPTVTVHVLPCAPALVHLGMTACKLRRRNQILELFEDTAHAFTPPLFSFVLKRLIYTI